MSYMCACGRSSSCLCELRESAPSADRPTLRDQLVERLRDLTYRGRNMTGPEANAYAAFLLPVFEAEVQRRESEAVAAALEAVERTSYTDPTRSIQLILRQHLAAIRAQAEGQG